MKTLLRLFRRRQLDADMREEMRAHLDAQTQRNLAAGMSPDDARAAAHRQFGGVAQIQERARDPMRWFDDLVRDARYGVRALCKRPGFTTTAVVTLAFGIGACATIFSVFEAVLLRPPPYPNPAQLVTLTEQHREGYIRATSFPNFVDWQAQSTTLHEIAATSNVAYNLVGDGEPERIAAQRVSASFFPLLAVPPQLGRWFTAGDDRVGAERVVIISHELWQRRFAGRPDVLGRGLLLDGSSHRVVGVMPAGFHSVAGGRHLSLDDTRALWTPLAPETGQRGRGLVFLRVLGRLQPGISRERATEELNIIASRLAGQFPGENAGFSIHVRDLHGALVENARPTMWLLLSAIAVLLLLVCTNVANLFLLRAAARRGEMTVRTALGASRGRIVRQLLTESCLVAVSGSLLGLLLSWSGVHLLRGMLPQGPVPLHGAEINLTIVATTLMVSLATGILFGLAPALHLARSSLQNSLKASGQRAIAAGGDRLRHGLVVAEVAFAFVLLAGAGLVIKSLSHVLDADPGFRAENVLTMRIHLSPAQYSDSARIRGFYDELLTRLATRPDVEAAGAVSALPMSGNISTAGFEIEGRPAPVGAANYTDLQTSTNDYFSTMGIPLLGGRLFGAEDHPRAPLVAVINHAMATRFWPGQNPVGRTMRLGGQLHEVIGVVGDVRHFGLNATPRPETYLPLTQRAESSMMLALRTRADATSLVPEVRALITQLDLNVPIADVRTLAAATASSAENFFSVSLLLGAFAGAALVLAVLGLYGVISFAVANRTREIGIRLALGAPHANVRGMVLRQGLRLVVAGIVIGFIVSLGSGRLLTGLLYEVRSTDPLTYGAVAASLLTVALLAFAIPARRAAKVDPVEALRAE